MNERTTRVDGLKQDGRPVYFGVAVKIDGSELKKLLLERVDARRAEAEELRAKAEAIRERTAAMRRELTRLPDSMSRHVDEDPARRVVQRAKFAERVVSVLQFVARHMEVSATYVLDGHDLRDFDLLGMQAGPGYSVVGGPFDVGGDDD